MYIYIYAKPRVTPGRLSYSDAYSHVFEKYWDYLPCLDRHPDFGSETQFSRMHMKSFSETISSMSLDGFRPRPVVGETCD
jgi:hypothetical protein